MAGLVLCDSFPVKHYSNAGAKKLRPPALLRRAMDAGTECSPSLLYLKSAFLAMEPTDCLISLARQSGGGSITTGVQLFILEHCINNITDKGTAWNRYIRNILKKVIAAVESSQDEVVEGLYEQFTHHMALPMVEDTLNGNRVCKQISFLFFGGQDNISSAAMNLVIKLQCSLNMLEGDTGCALWPSSLFLSEFILSHAEIFASKSCFEVGAGVGLVGISLTHVGASKVILTDGDTTSLSNLKLNTELNQLNTETKLSLRTCGVTKSVECKYLQWESASAGELQNYQPDIVLGADIIYDPLSLPHLIRVLSILLHKEKSCFPERQPKSEKGGKDNSQEARVAPIAYIATVIRNSETFSCFLRLAGEAYLSVSDITESSKPMNLLPYMLSYDRSSVRLYKVSSLYT